MRSKRILEMKVTIIDQKLLVTSLDTSLDDIALIEEPARPFEYFIGWAIISGIFSRLHHFSNDRQVTKKNKWVSIFFSLRPPLFLFLHLPWQNILIIEKNRFFNIHEFLIPFIRCSWPRQLFISNFVSTGQQNNIELHTEMFVYYADQCSNSIRLLAQSASDVSKDYARACPCLALHSNHRARSLALLL